MRGLIFLLALLVSLSVRADVTGPVVPGSVGSLAQLPQIANGTILGNTSGSTAAPSALTRFTLASAVTGSLVSNYYANVLTNTDTAAGAVNSLALAVNEHVGTGANGQKIAIQGATYVDSATVSSGQSYVGVLGVAQGVAAAPTAALYAINALAVLNSGVTGYSGVKGFESDITLQSGSGTANRIGVGSADNGSAVQASGEDAGFDVYAANGSAGFKMAYQVGNFGGGQPITSTILGTSGAYTVPFGVNLSGWTFSTSAFKSTGYNVDGSGNVSGISLAGTTQSTTVPALTLGTTTAAVTYEIIANRAGFGYDTAGPSSGSAAIWGGTGKGIEFFVNGTNGSFLSGTLAMDISGADGGVVINNAGAAPTGGDKGAGTLNVAAGLYTAGSLLASSTAPTISSGFGTSPTIGTAPSTAVFTVNVGSGGSASTGVLTMPATTTAWACYVNDKTTTSSTVFMTKVTASTTTSVTVGNFNTSGAAAAWVASDVLQFQCTGY